MIDIKQIKQGNRVQYAYDIYWNKEVRGESVEVDLDIYLDIDSHPERFDPIELNVGKLIEYGFKWENAEKRHLQLFFPHGAFAFYFENGKPVQCQLYDEPGGCMIELDLITHLHMLQNFIYFIFQEELKITNL
jgi:hypothetical protein